MPLLDIDHYFVRANDLERSRRFYCAVLGFEEMPRPDFGFPGYWLGVNGRIQVHMGPHGIPDWRERYLGTTGASPASPGSASRRSGATSLRSRCCSSSCGIRTGSPSSSISRAPRWSLADTAAGQVQLGPRDGPVRGRFPRPGQGPAPGSRMCPTRGSPPPASTCA